MKSVVKGAIVIGVVGVVSWVGVSHAKTRNPANAAPVSGQYFCSDGDKEAKTFRERVMNGLNEACNPDKPFSLIGNQAFYGFCCIAK